MITAYISQRNSGKTSKIINNAISCEKDIVYIFTFSNISAQIIYNTINEKKNNVYFKNNKAINICWYSELISFDNNHSELDQKIYSEFLRNESIKFFFDDFYLESIDIVINVSRIFENYSKINDLDLDIYSSIDSIKKNILESNYFLNPKLVDKLYISTF